jgi:hypothetical protein
MVVHSSMKLGIIMNITKWTITVITLRRSDDDRSMRSANYIFLAKLFTIVIVLIELFASLSNVLDV